MPQPALRRRPSARLLVVGPDGRILLFRFAHSKGPLAGQSSWATPGGGVEPGETFEQAALRELMEETGIQVEGVGAAVAAREVEMQLPNGELVIADERYFLVEVRDHALAREGWTAEERDFLAEHRWWSAEELEATGEQIWPRDLTTLVEAARAAR